LGESAQENASTPGKPPKVELALVPPERVPGIGAPLAAESPALADIQSLI